MGSLPCFCRLFVSLVLFLVWSVDDKCHGLYVHTIDSRGVEVLGGQHRAIKWRKGVRITGEDKREGEAETER